MHHIFILGLLIAHVIKVAIAVQFMGIQSRSRLTSSPDLQGEEISDNERLRNLRFWSKAMKIYLSYKSFQIRAATHNGVNGIFQSILHKDYQPAGRNITAEWEQLHEENSDRMLDLCLSLRGFYLKSGQFLGTRADFMPMPYLVKLSKLHDSVPPMPGYQVQRLVEEELKGPISSLFTSFDLDQPIGSASVAQVHRGVWSVTGQEVAVKIQNPSAKRLMTGDLRNLRLLAEFLQRTELKFDILSAVLELQRQVHREFDFRQEAAAMGRVGPCLMKRWPAISVPLPITSTNRILVMELLHGDNLSRLAGRRTDRRSQEMARGWQGMVRQGAARGMISSIAKAWAVMIFEIRLAHCDPHPGNLMLLSKGGIGLLDWGQTKEIAPAMLTRFARLVIALAHRNTTAINTAFLSLGVKVGDPKDSETVEALAVTMFDTRPTSNFPADPFSPACALRRNPVLTLPSELYFIVRTVQLLRGLGHALGIEGDDKKSLSTEWMPFAEKVLLMSPE